MTDLIHSHIGSARRIVVKVGSSSLTTRGGADTSDPATQAAPGRSPVGGLDPVLLDRLVDALAGRQAEGIQVVLVSSGAIAAGLRPLGLRRRPVDLATQQAAASVGQMLLVERYATSFARHGLLVGQVLLSADDLHHRAHYRNAQRALEKLLTLDVVPVINENDAVATDEIRFGDNDRLAALVAHLVGADALVLLSDVDGLYDGDPRRPGARLLAEVRGPADLADVQAGGTGSAGVGTGGMASKVEAARIATEAGIPVLLANAAAVATALVGRAGTFFHPTGRRPASRLFWLRHATVPRGSVVLDTGAVDAVVRRRKSLLSAGITAVRGDFAAGDPVDLVDPAGAAVARGLVSYDAEELPALLGRSTHELAPQYQREVVHRDDLVVL